MALGRQVELRVGWAELPRAPGQAFYDRLQTVLVEAGFDGLAEQRCAPYCAGRRGRPSLPPGRYFRMHLVGSCEGIDSERGLEWRCADSLSLREFLRPGTAEPVPDQSWPSQTRWRLPLEVHAAVFTRRLCRHPAGGSGTARSVLQRLAEHGPIQGDRIGVDASTMEADAALRSSVRRDSGEGYRVMLERLAVASGIATPTAADLIRLDRQRTGKRLSNQDWASPSDPEAKVAKMKDGRTRLASKPEPAVDLDPGAVVAAAIHPADRGDTTTLPGTLEAAAANLAAVDAAPTPEDPAELIADQGCHSRAGSQDLDDGARKSRIADKKVRGVHRWHGDEGARRAVHDHRARLRSGAAKAAFELRAALVERSFAPTLERGGMRRARRRGRANLHERYPVHGAGYDLGLIMRLLVGAGTPRAFLARPSAKLLLVTIAADAPTGSLIVATGTETAMLVVSFAPHPHP
jgi:transposase